MFIKGEGGFKDRDLYPFCANLSDGKVLATQAKTLSGTDGRTLKDTARKSDHLPMSRSSWSTTSQVKG
jgi:hypothetical protein